MARRRKSLAFRWEAPEGWRASDGCTILGCGRKGIARGMCWAHYARARRGAPVTVLLRQPVAGEGKYLSTAHFGPAKPSYRVLRMARIAWDIHTKFSPEALTGCFLWEGDYFPSGYGQLGTFRDPWGGYAHRAALYFSGVALEPGHKKHVRHLCNNPACVNPRHLAYGTAKENMADRTARYRSGELPRTRRARGLRGPRLPASLVAYIAEAHALGVSRAELSRDLGIQWPVVDLAVRFAALPHIQQHAA